MINYEPFWKTLKKKKVTKYQLINNWGISSNTLRRMSNNLSITTNTLNELCMILDCKVSDVILFTFEEEERIEIEKHKELIETTKKKPWTNK